MFYSNIVSIKICFYVYFYYRYCFLSGFAGTSFFNTFSLTTYNIVFTSLPIVLYVLDKDVPEEYAWNHPSIYGDTQRGDHMTVPTVVGWGFRAFYQVITIYI